VERDPTVREIQKRARSAKAKRARAEVLRGEAADELARALELVRASGYVSADELARQAGMTRANLYDLVRRRAP
jgi:DNA-binding phage protein